MAVAKRRKKMADIYQLSPFLLARASGLLLSRRIYFPKNRLGETIQDEEEFKIFRQMILDPTGDQPERPDAIFKVCFHFARFSVNTNKTLSLIPIPFIIAQPGFRSKTWLIGQKTGVWGISRSLRVGYGEGRRKLLDFLSNEPHEETRRSKLSHLQYL